MRHCPCDLRKIPDAFGKWLGFWLSGESEKELLVPAGFGYGYLVRVTKEAAVSYKYSQKFYSKYDDGIAWNDTGLGIEWPFEKWEG